VEGRLNCDSIFNEIIVAARRLNRNPNTSSNIASASSDSGGAPAFCTAGFNGDRNDGSLMGGGNRAQMIAEQFGVSTVGQ
jgi:hypothetical protein